MWKMALFLGSIFHLQHAKLKRLEPELKETLLKPISRLSSKNSLPPSIKGSI
jgi:hypothetical protein